MGVDRRSELQAALQVPPEVMSQADVALLESIGKPKHTPIHLYKEGAKITNPIWVEVFS